MQSLVEEKNKTASQLEAERKKRQKAEKRLRLAEDSLKRLDRALRESGVKIDLEIETDVKNLREFFEECIEEERFAAEKLMVMKEAIHAKTEYKKSVGSIRLDSLSPPPAQEEKEEVDHKSSNGVDAPQTKSEQQPLEITD
jgi:hypothetical protein